MGSQRKFRNRDEFPSDVVTSRASPYTEAVIDRILRVATRGRGSNRVVALQVIESGQYVTREFSVRDGLKLKLDAAIRIAAYSREWRSRHREDGELIKMLSKIEKSARSLLLALQVSRAHDDLPIPTWLHHNGGLHWQAANDPIAANRVVANTPACARPAVVGKTLIRDAVAGVEDLSRWSHKAREDLERRLADKAKREDEQDGPPTKVEREWLIEMGNIWRDVFERIDTDSRTFGSFASESGEHVGLKISPDAARKAVPPFGKALRRSMGNSAKREQR
jgi:hypothetical protein